MLNDPDYVAEAIANAKLRLEAEQDRPLTIEQLEILHRLCLTYNVEPLSVLDSSLFLIVENEPESPLLDHIDDDPDLLAQLGRVLHL